MQTTITDRLLWGRTFLYEEYTDPSPQFHKEIFELLGDKRYKRKGIIAPRGFSKTTIILTEVLYRLCNATQPEVIILISESEDQAIHNLESIIQHLEGNPLIRQAYGDLVGDKVWGKKRIILKNGCLVWARGTRQKIRGLRKAGYRPTFIILDDFESEANTQTDLQIQYIKKWLLGAVLPMLDPVRGEIVAIGTIVTQNAFLPSILPEKTKQRLGISRLADQKEEEEVSIGPWRTLFYQASEDPYQIDEGSELWAERFPASYLRTQKEVFRKQNELGLFYREYYNIPVSQEDKTLDPPVWKGYYQDGSLNIEHRESPVPVGRTLSVDFGGTGTYTVFEVMGWEYRTSPGEEMNGEWIGYEIDTIRGHFPEGELISKLFEAVKKYRVQTVSIEKVALQAFFVKDRIYEEMRKRNAFFDLQEYTPRGDKMLHRLPSLAPLFGAKALYLREGSPTLDECHWFPKGSYVDCIDALEQATHYRIRSREWEVWDTNETYKTEEQPNWMVL